MGLIERLMGGLFGPGCGALRDTVEVFRESAEGRAGRAHALREAALAQFAAEFAQSRRGWFDRLVDGLNRLPRPAMALGTLGLIGAAMVDPVWFSERMQGLALIPEPLWWLMGAVVSFYFGARAQAKGQDFQRSLAATLAAYPAGGAVDGKAPHKVPATAAAWGNAALADWRAERRDE
ncbi:carboxylesterase [Mesobaculum littorinae]|uniref:Carboxylesterase n=1 Tax=Mesobaculum littorinae TaxID=2486419 RepID=A0A438AKU3_9RHOB|nr:holin family protein [Mesobaculum littorinae]RVV99264.1 carboxylesterase [Mesobaculum littorinae]